MAEIYNENVITWLAANKKTMVDGLVAAQEMSENGSKYTSGNKTTLLNTIKAACVAISALDVSEYVGNNTP
tara:strand:- start:354 stop:566 length:213 start_codon:yes stop_codon:yes gene_type:complete